MQVFVKGLKLYLKRKFLFNGILRYKSYTEKGLVQQLKSKNCLIKFMTTETKFVVCIENKNYPASLEFGKICRNCRTKKPKRTK